MGNTPDNALKKGNLSLEQSLDQAASVITKDYLADLERCQILPPKWKDIDIDLSVCGRFYRLSRLVLNNQENFLSRLTTVVNVVSSIDCSLVTIIKSDGSRIEYYLGIVSRNVRGGTQADDDRRAANAAAFHGALLGNLAGSELTELEEEDVASLCQNVLSRENECYASVSGLVALRDQEDKSPEGYVQGIEHLVDSLKGQRYTIVMLADPLNAGKIQEMQQGYEALYTQLSALEKSTLTLNESDTSTLSQATTKGISDSISNSVTMTQGQSQSTGHSSGFNVGGYASIIFAGVNASYNRGNSSSETTQQSIGRARGDIHTNSQSNTDTKSSAKSIGRSTEITSENRSVKSLLDKIDKNLQRLEECECFGAFHCAAYVIADDRETACTVASNYNALMRGSNSGIQASHINQWYRKKDTEILRQYLGALVHPRFQSKNGDNIYLTPASVVSGKELAIQIGLPKSSVSGITVIPMAPFGRNPWGTDRGTNPQDADRKTISLGKVYHMGRDEDGETQQVSIDVQSLAMHTFITGSTGAGKTTAICSILDKLMQLPVTGRQEKIKFMVIEPAKGEYKHRFGGYPDISVYGTNDKLTPLLRINPFSFPDDTTVLEHIDRLIEIFNVCWPMYAAMPAVMKDAVERAYQAAGWNLGTSECRYRRTLGIPLYPCFADVLEQVRLVMEESAYSADSKGDYTGALCTRLKSLTNGLYSKIFTADELTEEDLFDSNVIVDLSRVGSAETKALIMGLLVMKLQEHRMSQAQGGNEALKHLTVLEEAHHILRGTPVQMSNDTSNLLGKSVEMLANSIAEMRTYGEGFIIADQAPGLMDRSAIRNTNTKIILRLPDREDGELVGQAAALNEDQIQELPRLRTFIAAVYQNEWQEPVLCHMDHTFVDHPRYRCQAPAPGTDAVVPMLQYLLLPPSEQLDWEAVKVDALIRDVLKLSIPMSAKLAFLSYTKATEKEERNRLRGLAIYPLFNASAALSQTRADQSDIKVWYRHFKEVLDPDISGFSEADQARITAALIRAEAERYPRDNASIELFENLMTLL